MKTIDNLLNKVTMYRLVVYELAFLILSAVTLSFFKILPGNPVYILFSAVFLFYVSWIANKIFAWAYDAPSNPESTWITALILVLIITPPARFLDMQYLPLAFWAATLAVGSKYIVAIGKKHLFNPVAFGVAATALFLGLSASWWIGTPILVPFVIVGGLLLVRKIHRFDLFFAFLGTFTAGIIFFALHQKLSLSLSLSQSLLYAPAFFFATVMLTEPLTTPPTRFLRILYGMGVGILFLPYASIGSFYFTPELALIAGNIFAYIVSPKQKLVLKLKDAERLSPNVYEFSFATDKRISYKPGQYMEWTLAHKKSDNRSFRRYFTLSSSPTERDIKMGVKFYQPASSFKKALLSINKHKPIIAAQLSGDFVMPRDKKKKLVFVAGGIGITPFRSMIKYMVDKNERRSVTLLYSNKSPEDAIYKDLFDHAEQKIGLKTVYAFTDKNTAPPSWAVGKLDENKSSKKFRITKTEYFIFPVRKKW